MGDAHAQAVDCVDWAGQSIDEPAVVSKAQNEIIFRTTTWLFQLQFCVLLFQRTSTLDKYFNEAGLNLKLPLWKNLIQWALQILFVHVEHHFCSSGLTFRIDYI